MPLINLEKILKVAVRGGASDIILKPHCVPQFRFHGELRPLEQGFEVAPEDMNSWIQQILPRHIQMDLTQLMDEDFGYELPGHQRFRVSVFRSRGMLGMSLRVINPIVRTIEELQLPEVLGKLAIEKRGLILVTGATGSGKSTTLAAMLQRINLTKANHIITIEDPVEFYFKNEKSSVTQRELGLDTKSFAGALRGSLRQSPDVILVGELRDRETIETALMAAETGHLVLSTLHTTDAVESFTRILSFFPSDAQANIRFILSNVLLGILSQRLIERASGKGMAAATEFLANSPSVSAAVLEGRFSDIPQLIRTGKDIYSMHTFDQSILNLLKKGAISKEVALRNASNRNDMELSLKGIQ